MGNCWQVLSAGHPAANQSNIGHASEVIPTSKQTYLKRQTVLQPVEFKKHQLILQGEQYRQSYATCNFRAVRSNGLQIRILGNPLAPNISRPVREREADHIHVVPSVLVVNLTMKVQGARRSMRVDLRVDTVIVKCHIDMNRPFSPRVFVMC
jgi:hypothetical protein